MHEFEKYFIADGLDAQGNELENGAIYSVYDFDQSPAVGILCQWNGKIMCDWNDDFNDYDDDLYVAGLFAWRQQ